MLARGLGNDEIAAVMHLGEPTSKPTGAASAPKLSASDRPRRGVRL